ncbi:carbamoyltransferase family protein [Cohaesibacter celericrescens]|uniref:Carbamoyltransferase n=1 Tax=Cohaesibacter celericrescens TaxID=2067669 RepID=A0A2N5XQ02_9HYPH|nr:carbamoyltransferase [Cohaesibacter celericrescens]PLW76573.1 hypothetical protein C0081_13975 [Cohaesibacter celericrescens]
MKILGISAYYHDAAAAIVQDGTIIAAASEERFSRIKGDPSFPKCAIRFCLEKAGLDICQLDAVVFYDKPFPKFERLIETTLSFAPAGFSLFNRAMPVWIKQKLFQKNMLRKELQSLSLRKSQLPPLLFSEHHLSHAASAYYPSPFDEALILVSDGVGEWATTSIAYGEGHAISPLQELRFPHSLGLLYAAFTYYLGFKVNSGEYKMMGLAAYGTPRYTKTILDNIVDLKPDGSFHLNLDFFGFCHETRMTSERFHTLFGGEAREADHPILNRHLDIAASIQDVTEQILLLQTRHMAKKRGTRNLCFAGGVALNVAANGRILRDGLFKKIWVQPAAGDAGGAIGAALAGFHLGLKQPRPSAASSDGMKGGYLGPAYTSQEIQRRLSVLGAKFSKLNENEIISRTASALSEQKVVGWFQGAMEFGPRALGNRSILADARNPQMKAVLNERIKFRETFRPFAPAIPEEYVADYFDLAIPSPYMQVLATVKNVHCDSPLQGNPENQFVSPETPRSPLPAITHVDGSARVQTVNKSTNPQFHSLLMAFGQETGCPVLINTSFNIRGEPLVCSPEDAYQCFMGANLDILVIGDLWLEREEQPEIDVTRYRNAFEAD